MGVPFAIASAEKAAEMVEVNWEAYLRDVPFADYMTNQVIQEACDDLSSQSGYRGPRDPVIHKVMPATLFRYDFPDALKGPMVSQILYQTFRYDDIEVEPKMQTRQPVIDWNADGSFAFNATGRDFLTSFSEWFAVQNGVPNPATNVFDEPRFIRSVRDLGHLAGSDIIYSVYFRASVANSTNSRTTWLRAAICQGSTGACPITSRDTFRAKKLRFACFARPVQRTLSNSPVSR